MEFKKDETKNDCKSNLADRKCQDYVYSKWEHQSTMQKIKHYLRHENKVTYLPEHFNDKMAMSSNMILHIVIANIPSLSWNKNYE